MMPMHILEIVQVTLWFYSSFLRKILTGAMGTSGLEIEPTKKKISTRGSVKDIDQDV